MTTADNSRSEPFSRPAPTRNVCVHCRGPMAGRREGAEYCSNVCKRAAFDERAKEGRVASVRRLKGGKMSVVVHMSDTGLKPGDAVRVA